LAFPANTKGKFYMRIDGMVQIIHLNLSRVQRNGENYLKIDKMTHDFIVKDAKLNLQEEQQKEFREFH
jgi:hypothetical protein